MGLVIALIVIALVLGAIGIIAEALWWLLVIAAIVFVVGLVRGVMARGTSRSRT
jgi:hypothetical protein